MEIMFPKTLKRYTHIVRLWRIRKWKIITILAVGICSLLVLFTQIVLAVKEEHVFIFPVRVESQGWESPEHAFQQDLSSTARVEGFTVVNSAFIGVTSTSSDDTTVASPSNSDKDETNTDPLLSKPEGDDTSSGDSVPAEAEGVLTEPTETTAPANQGTDEAGSLTPALGIFSVAHAQESTASSSEEFTTRCRVLSTDCRTMIFSGFSLGGALDEALLESTTISLSLGGKLTTPGTLSVTYRAGAEWKVAGEIQLIGDVSNELRGGFLRFPMPEIASWDQIDTMEVLVEFLPDDPLTGVGGEVYLDALWLDAGYERTDSVDLADLPNVTTDIGSRDQELRREEADTLRLGETTVSFVQIPDSFDGGIQVKAVRPVAIGLRSAEYMVNVTNTSDQDFVPSLSFLGLPDTFTVETAEFWDPTRRETRSNVVTGVTGYFCEGGWASATSSDVFTCETSGENRLCSATNDDATNCIVEDDQVGVENVEVVVPGFSPLSVRTYTEVSALARLFGQFEAKAKVTPDLAGVATVPLDRILSPGETTYVRFRVTFDENTTGQFSLLASGDTGASALGTLGWDALWTKRIPVSIHTQNDVTGELGVVTRIPVGPSQNDFWESVRSDAGDVRLVDEEAGIEIPFGITRFDYEKRQAEIWGRLSTLRPNATSTLYLYFGNPMAERADDLSAVLSTDDPSPRSIVVGNDVGAIVVDVMSYLPETRVRVGNEEPVSLDRGEMHTFERMRSGDILSATGPITGTISGGDGSHVLVPLSFSGTTFVIPDTGAAREIMLSAVDGPVSVERWAGRDSQSADPVETIELTPGTPSLRLVLPSGTITLSGDASFVVTLDGGEGDSPTILSPLKTGSSIGLSQDRTLLSTLEDGSEYRIACVSAPAEEKDGRRGGETFLSRACTKGVAPIPEAFEVIPGEAPLGVVSEDLVTRTLLSVTPMDHFGKESILPVRASAVAVSCATDNDSSWQMYRSDGSLVRAGNCAPGRSNVEQEIVLPVSPETSFEAGLWVRTVGTSSDPVILSAKEALPGGEMGTPRLMIVGGEVESRGVDRDTVVVLGSAERVFPHDRRVRDLDAEGREIDHINELLSDARDFSAQDLPLFHFRFTPHTSSLLSGLRDALGMSPFSIERLSLMHYTLGEIDADIEVLSREGDEWTVQVKPKKDAIRPGKYTLRMEINDNGEIVTDAFDFYWGMLAVNTDQSEYGPESDVLITAGALTNSGNTICDARLSAQITRPDGTKDDLDLPPSGFCSGNNVTSVPDYFAHYRATSTGTYLLHLVETDDAGTLINEIRDTFVVSEDIPYTIRRTGPTRIYPLSLYEMALAVTAKEDFTGELVEKIEKDFVVTDRGGAFLKDEGDHLSGTWSISLRAGETQTFTYRFDAPNVSPYRFHLGPASLKTEDGASAYSELRQWQIASDAAGQMMLYWDDGASVPAGWTCVSCSGGDPFATRLAVGAATYGTTLGAATHTHVASSSVVNSPVNADGSAATPATENTQNTLSITASDHIHNFDSVIASTTTLPRSRSLRIIRSNTAGDVSLPVGAIAIFDVASSSLPTSWYRYAPQDGYFLYGSTTVGTLLGSSTHTHVISSSTDNSSGTLYRQRVGGTQVTAALASHQHTLNATTTLSNHEPQYLEVVLAKLSVATGTTNGMITMWNDTPATGWVTVSDSNGPFYGKYIKASTTYGGTGGSLAHIPTNLSATTSSSTNNGSARQVAPNAGLSSSHFHRIDLTFSETANIPPSIEVIYAKRSVGISAYTQQDFRFYVNTNAITPTDPWPSGALDLAENEAGSDVTTSIRPTQVIRLRMNVLVQNATNTAGSQAWKLQYSASNDCATSLNWNDVASTSSSTAAWRGYNNTGVTNNATLSSYLLSTSTVAESYVEENNATATPVQIPLAGVGEWDWVIQNNAATPNTNYCFRMAKSDGSLLDVYSNYPTILTNQAPDAPELSAPFDNEALATTTPSFDFTATDPESNDLDYAIEIDDDPAFGSPILSKDSTNDPDLFINVPNGTNKSPFNAGDTIRYKATSALTNGTTYWWRVRAIDSNGSNTYGAWSSAHSLTIDSSVSVSRWYQTTAAQFQTDTLQGTNATSSTNNYVTLTTGSTTGTTTSTDITFSSAATGTAWGSVSWNANVPVGTFLVRVEYYTSTGSWAYIPDSVLSGNSAGFASSPISLLNVNPNTYGTIRLRADFTGASGSGPRLLDWTVDWAFVVNTPTLYKLFDNEKTNTTTPSFEFSTTDPQGDSLTYEFQWSTSPSFTSSTTRSSAAHAGFVDLSTGDTNPFNSGDRIRFTIQAADALTASTTYWWRVRATDPSPGSGTFSFYSDARSFTVDLSVNVPTWFQTTLGQFDTDALTGAETFSGDAVRVSTSTTEAMIVYGEGTVQTPRYRIWSGTTWSAESSALTIGAIVRHVVLKGSPVGGEYLLGTTGSDRDVNLQIYSGGAWGEAFEIATNISNTDARGVDVAWETLSGDAMAVACDGDNEPSYSTWDGSDWAPAQSTIVFGATTSCEWIRLASDPSSDEIIMMMRNTGSRFYAAVWNGSSWTASTSLGQQVETNNEGMTLAYEDSGNQAVIVTSSGGTSVNITYNTWDGSVWGTAATQALGDHPEFMELKADDGTDNMALCYIDNDTDIGTLRWTGAGWSSPTTEHDGSGNSKVGRAVDCEFETNGSRDGYIMVPYSDTTNARYQNYNGAWLGVEGTIGTVQDSFIVQARRTTDGLILATFFDDVNRRYDFSYWNGTTWSTEQTLETSPSDTATPFREVFMMAPKLPATIGSVVSDAIDFDDGVSPAWDRVLWSATTTGSSTVAIQVEYLTATGTWALIPDTDLPGNSVGDTSTATPISLTNLSTATYNQIRLRATLTCILGACPTLNDWTVKWAEGIDLSGTAKQFDLTSNVTSGTVAVAVNGTIQTGKTGTISGGNWSIDNVTVFPGNVVTVFVDGANDANEAVNVSRYVGPGDMGGIQLNERHLTIGAASSTATTTTNSDISRYDNSVSSDEDVFHDVSAGNDLVVCFASGCGGAGLVVAYGTYRPDSASSGNVDTYDIHINATTTADGNTFTVGGSWDNNFIFSANTGSVTLTATTGTRSIDSTGATTASFNTLTFGSGSGSATWNLSSPLTVLGDLTVNYGTLSPGSATVSIEGNLTFGANGGFAKGSATTTFAGSVSKTWTDNTTAKQDLGIVLVDGTSKTVTLGSGVRATDVTIGANDTLDVTTSNHAITVLGNWQNNNVFNARSGTTTFAGGAGVSRSIDPGTSPFHHLAFTGTSTWSFTIAGATTTGNVSIATGTLRLPSGTFSVGGGFRNSGGSFTGGTTLKFTSTASGNALQAGTSTWPELLFTGSGGVWTMLDTNATTTGSVIITAGSLTLPSGTLEVPRAFDASGGAFVANGGTLKLTATSSTFNVRGNNSSFASLLFSGGGSWTMLDTNATTTGTFQITNGSTTLPSGTLAVGGSFLNSGTFTHASGTVKMISTATGNSITPGNSQFGNLELRSSTGGWTVTSNATTSGAFTLTSAGAFIQTSGTTFETRGTFTNLVGGASTTWSGSRLWLNSSTSYSMNASTSGADAYGILTIGAGTQVKSWNSTSTVNETSSTGSLYSQDHNAVDGSLYIFGNYSRTSGSDYWSYATDFDGTALSGGSRRAVTVRFSSSATTTFTNATLQIIGDPTASTTVTNQGSGTYGVVISGGTINADSYVFRNLGNQGLQLLASTTIVSLAHGDFELAVGGGTLITMSSTTIDKNQGAQIDQVRFATSTAITGSNVTELGTATSSIRFRFHYGNIAGEAYDSDPGGNPGNIRWDDSNYIITISGRVYADAGVTPLGAPICDDVTPIVRVKVENGGDFTAPCSSGTATGTYSIPGVTFSGDLTFTVYLDSEGAAFGAVIMKSATADVSAVNIYQNRVIVRHEDVSPMTIADMNAWDFDDEPDLPFTVSTSGTPTLLVHANTEFWVWAGETFAPGGNMTITSGGSGNSYDGKFHLDNGATFTGTALETHTVGGSWQADSASIFSGGGSAWVFNGTSTGKLITAVPSVTFGSIQVNGTGGGWSTSGTFTVSSGLTMTAGTLSGTGNMTVQSGGVTGNGTISMTGGTFTVQGTSNFGGNTDWSFSALTFGDGATTATTTKTGSSTITTNGVLTVTANTTLLASNSRWVLLSSGTPLTVSGTLSAQTSTFRYATGTAMNIRPLTYYRLELAPIVSGSPTYTILAGTLITNEDFVVGDGTNPVTVTANTNDPTLSISRNVLVATSSTMIGSDSGSFSVQGSWTTSGSYTHSAGTVTFSATTTGKTISASTSPFGTLNFNGSSGGWTILGNATTTGGFSLTAASAFTLSSGATLEVDGTFTNLVGGASTTWTGTVLHLNSGTSYTINTKTSGSDLYELMRMGTATDVKMWNSSSTQVSTLGTASLYSQNHAAVNGDLFIWGDYVRSSGTEYWSYATDFDGTALGSPRTVTVRFASSSAFALTGGGWEVYGSSTATTSIGRQGGGGAYALRISGGSTTAQYYQVRNADGRGLDISGSPTINSLSDGDFEVAQGGGSGMTVAAAAIDANPLKIFFRNRFATTTAIAAYNVTATGSSTSAWRFSSHLASTTPGGNLGGEYFDNDPGGDPGMLIWDDSAANITITGVVYQDSGVTPMGSPVCDGSTQNVRLKVQGLGTYTASCNSGTGQYTISNVIFNPGDTLTVFLDTAGVARGVTVSMDPATNVLNMDIYRNTVILRHEGLTGLAITNIDQYDYNNDTDIPFITSLGAPNTLSVFSGTELRIWTGKTFAPGGNVTVHANASTTETKDGSIVIENGATFQSSGSQVHTFGGRFTVSSTGTFTAANSSVSFTASTTGKVITPNTSTFYDVSFTGQGGGWSFGSGYATATNNMTISGGSVALPTSILSVGGNFTENTTPSSFTSATGSIVKFTSTATGKTITAGTSTWAELLFSGIGGGWTFQDAGATSSGSVTVASGTVVMPVGTFAVGADFQNLGGTITANQSSSLKLTSTSTATVRMGGSSLGDLLYTGGGTYTMSDTNATTTGSLRIISGTTTLPAGVLEVRRSFVNSDKFTHASGTVKMTGTTTGYFVTAGNSSFGNLELNNSGGGWTITGNATTSGTFSLLAANTFVLTSGMTLESRGTFTNLVGGAATTWTGSRLYINNGSANYTINSKTQGGDLYNILSIGPATNLRSWNSSAGTYEVNGTASLYSQDNAAIDGELYIFGDYQRTSGTDYWSYATDFDGTALGGSSRAVTVRHASGATSTFTGSSLQIVGASGATTTITNQGAGVYNMVLSSATLNANYHAFRNLATSGLQLIGATTLSSFQNGDFELAVQGGNLITIASTTIDQNASGFFTRIRFATTTAITGRNVKRSGTSSAAVTFQTHTGNLAGESFDDDGSDACGQVRFDDSACLFVDQPHYRWRYDDGGEAVPAGEWYDVNWSKRKRVTITNANASAVTNAAVTFDVGYDVDMQADFDDIRFTDSSGTTSLSYWFELVNASATSTVWVKVPSLPVGETVIYMYYGNNTAPSAGSGTSTFTFFDDFEDGSIADYSGDTSLFSALGTMNYERTYGLGASSGNEGGQTTDGIGQASLGIGRDTTFRFFQYIDTSAGPSDESCVLFGVQAPFTGNQNYAVCLQPFGTDKVVIARNASYNGRSDGATQLVTKTVTWTTGWYETEVDWLSDNTIYVSVYDSVGSLFATTSTSSATYTSGGIGFTFWGQHGGWDMYNARPYTATEPTAVIGPEQTNGGASWKSALDTLLANQVPGENVRLRLQVENSGTPIIDQTLRLEVAPKGASPNCESVPSGSYSSVPVAGSCGSAVACMSASSQFTDHAPTSDLLSVPTGSTFIPGEIIENSSNQSNDIDLDASTYTEVEYNFQITAYANGSAYCFRATDGGTPLDNYSRVAEMSILYPPTIGEYHFNNDRNIALIEGATTTIYATGTVSDLNGYSDISFATSTFYRSGLTRTCTANQNNCYQMSAPSCTFTNCSGNSCTFSCGADIYYFADPTDTGSTYESENWRAVTDIVDTSASRVTASSSQELYTLRALSASNTIAYGSVTVGLNTGSYNPTTTIRNTGNSVLNLLVSGTDMTSGSSTIAASNQKYATSTFTYGSCTNCSTLSTSSQAFNINLAKPTTTSAVSTIAYWGIAVPLNTSATTHTGANTLTAN